MTAPWVAGTRSIAHEEKKGKPITTPAETRTSCLNWAKDGSGTRLNTRTNAAKMAAISARPSPADAGESAVTTTFVTGRVRLKLHTPSKPYSMPAFSKVMPPSGFACAGVSCARFVCASSGRESAFICDPVLC